MNDFTRVYEDILESRRKETSNFIWISRQIHPKLAFKQGKLNTNPAHHKEEVLISPKIQELLDKLSNKLNVPKSKLEEQVRIILDEIGYNKKLKLIRWLGLVLTKICLKVCSGILVNGDNIIQIKSRMGNCPVVFVPSHRSYADFILMSYVCFQYDIAIPAIAAGMDFQGMWGMGTMLRDTGAFFMRRSYNDDSLYWTTFKQYIYQIVTKGDLPIEFFIEGTRSRSNKSMSPKFGFMAMVLKAFFLSQVPDILFVPISINYDRILEESLFAYELLGIPKPKETTSGFFKSLKILKESFGNIYFHFGEPISCKEFFGDKLTRRVHNLSPLHHQEITEADKSLIPSLSYEILRFQQENNVLNTFNLMALVLNNVFARCEPSISFERLLIEMEWTKNILCDLGANVFEESIENGVVNALNVHKNLIQLNPNNEICLVSDAVRLDKINPIKLKGHSLSDKTMTYSVPFIMLQIYVNPSLQCFVDLAVLVIVLTKGSSVSKDELRNGYNFLRTLLSKEFVSANCLDEATFQRSLSKSIELHLAEEIDGDFKLGSNKKLEEILIINFMPFLISYATTIDITQKLPVVCEEKTILANVQKVLEEVIASNTKFLHPNCLNLDTLGNCINILSSMNVLKKQRRENKNICETDLAKLFLIKEKLDKYVIKCHNEDTALLISQLQNKL